MGRVLTIATGGIVSGHFIGKEMTADEMLKLGGSVFRYTSYNKVM
jgi:hypothetical protein